MKHLWPLALAALALGLAPAKAQQAPVPPYHLVTANTNNAHLVDPAPGAVYLVHPGNPTTTLAYLKFYDKKTAPACGTDMPFQTYEIAFGAANSGGGFVQQTNPGIEFKNGLGICVTGGAADNDNTPAPAGITINLTYQ